LPVTDYGQMEFVPPESGGTDLIHIYCIGCAGLPPSKYMKITITGFIHKDTLRVWNPESTSAVVMILPTVPHDPDYQCHTIMVGEGKAS